MQSKRKRMFQRSQSFVSANQLLPLKHSFQYNEQQGIFNLSLEATVPIFCVAVMATVDVEFLELQGSVAILTVSDPPPGSSARGLATCRCHDSMPRVTVSMKIQEGQTGTVSAYIISRGTSKTSSVVRYPVMTLCLHHRVRNLDPACTMGSLEISGDFRSVDMHAWLLKILPDTPRQRQEGDVQQVYTHATLHTSLAVMYNDGTARFQSDNPCTLSLLRAALTKHANDSQTRIRTVTRLDKNCISAFVQRIFPLLKAQHEKQHHEQLLKGLQQACDQESDTSFLTEDMQKLLKKHQNPDNATAGRSQQQASLEILLDQLALGHSEWLKFAGRPLNPSEAAALQRAALEPNMTAPALAEIVTAS